MGKQVLVLIFGILSISFINIRAQADLQLPQKSLKAGCSLTIGLTDIEISYSSPSVDGRNIWGGIVPYDEVWRAGANEATTMEFGTEINIEGTVLPAGRYAFFVIPRQGDKEWTAIFNKQADQWGTYKYDPSLDEARINFKPQMKSVDEERLVYSIHDQGVDKGYIKLAWGKARIYLRFRVDVLESALENVDKALETAREDEKWIIFAQGASFLLDNDWQLRQAMEWADKSTRLHDHSWNWYVKARAQAASGDYTGAMTSIEKCRQLGTSDPADKFYVNSKEEVEASYREWRGR
jgi:tetratricopeptide (TPR) repeat protein